MGTVLFYYEHFGQIFIWIDSGSVADLLIRQIVRDPVFITKGVVVVQACNIVCNYLISIVSRVFPKWQERLY